MNTDSKVNNRLALIIHRNFLILFIMSEFSDSVKIEKKNQDIV